MNLSRCLTNPYFLTFLILVVNSLVGVPMFIEEAISQQLTENQNSVDPLIVYINIQRIGTQLNLTQYSLDNGDLVPAFHHAYVTHSAIFPIIEPILSKVDPASARSLKSLLTDLPIKIQTAESPREAYSNIVSDVRTLKDILNNISNSMNLQDSIKDKGFFLQVSAALLEDAIQSYELPNASSRQGNLATFNLQNTLGLVNTSQANFEEVANYVDERRRDEIRSFYNQIQDSLNNGMPFDAVASIGSAIERDFAEELTLSGGSESVSEQSIYFSTIGDLFNSTVASVSSGNYKAAYTNATKAYLDNFEYLEAPIEKHDPDLMMLIENGMREELRQMINDRRSPQEISALITEILGKLNQAENLLENDPEYLSNLSDTTTSSGSSLANIQGLRQGFGTYSGETHQMGEAEDPAKESVRNNVDRIRLKLSEMLKLYENNNYEGALLAARSAYLDSYEAVEIPLRPIDPDFTLEMEIKFAELRNLLQQHVTLAEVEEKTIEIRRGLDESERLVSGVGIVAPAIAFSTSFSIIFREGLESALIIGAILTYLQASRNTRFKKHVYYGILIAVIATAATWFVAQYMIEISGANRELIEAIAGLSAVAVLFWVSFWVLNKIETKKWIEFVKAKVWKATTTGSVIVFVALAFFTVYREGFETVLFYQAMLSYARYMELYVIAGMVLGLAVIIGVALIVNRLGRRLPLRALFALTMGIGAYMSIAFMGNAVRELQELGIVSTTPLVGIVPRLDINLASMTGIHPTLESVIAQIVLLSIYIIGSLYILVLKPRKQKSIESARKSMADLQRKKEG